MSLDGLFTGLQTIASDLLGAFPFRCFLLAAATPTATDASGFPATAFAATTVDPYGCSYELVTGKEVVIAGKRTAFTGYQFLLPAAATVTETMRLRLLATATDAQRDFEIVFLGDLEGVLRVVFCQLVGE